MAAEVIAGEITNAGTLGLTPVAEPEIDIGAPAIVRASSVTFNTIISLVNPANGTGIITTVQIYIAMAMTGLRFGTFYSIGGADYKCRDSTASLGDHDWGVRTFPGLSIAVVTGDFIGCYYAAGQLENDDFGGNARAIWGEHIDPGDEATYLVREWICSLYGT